MGSEVWDIYIEHKNFKKTYGGRIKWLAKV